MSRGHGTVDVVAARREGVATDGDDAADVVELLHLGAKLVQEIVQRLRLAPEPYGERAVHEQVGTAEHVGDRVGVDVKINISLDENAYKLREMNLQKMFGKTAFSKLICLDTGADKDEALSKYAGSNCFWLEDKVENATASLRFGLRPILMEHGHNMNADVEYPIVKNWLEVYKQITQM